MGRISKVNITDQEFLDINNRHENGELLKDIHEKEYKSKLSYEYFIMLFRRKHENQNKSRYINYNSIIKDYIVNNLNCDEVLKKYDLIFYNLRLAGYKRYVYFEEGKTYQQCNGNDISRKTKIELEESVKEKVREEYNTTLCTLNSLCVKYKLNLGALKRALSGTLAYKDTEVFKNLVINKYHELGSIIELRKFIGIHEYKLSKILKSYGVIVGYKNNDIHNVKNKKEVVKKPKVVKPKVEKPKVMKKKKTKKDRDLLASEMQKGNAKLKRREKVYATLPDEVKNKGYLLRIDAKTEIFVKDGVGPEIARQRYIDKYRSNFKL